MTEKKEFAERLLEKLEKRYTKNVSAVTHVLVTDLMQMCRELTAEDHPERYKTEGQE